MERLSGIDELKRRTGQQIGSSDWVTVSQGKIDAFAEASGDEQWIHTDPIRAAAESPFGTTIAHGFLTLALLSHLKSQAFEVRGARLVVNYGLNRVRFPAPVPAGARVRGRFAVRAAEEVPGGVQVTLDCAVEIEGSEKPAVVAEWLLRYMQ